MASKKFSRLSIMLEARDRMTKPMQQAARASQNLQSRVDSLSRTLNSGKNSVHSASVANRILAERYRELGQRISGTNDKVKLSAKIFRLLPAPIRLAAYHIEGYARATKSAIANNILVRSTTKVLTSTFKTLSTVTWNLSYYIGQAARKIYEFSRLGVAVKLLVSPFKLAALGAQKFGTAVKGAVTNWWIYKLMSTAIQDVGTKLKLAAINQMHFVKTIPQILKSTKTWIGLSMAVDKTKLKMREAYLAFNLWKNASPTVEKVSNSFDKLLNKLPRFAKLRENFKNINLQMDKLSGRRATFNQLADSNAKLNKELAKMNAELAKANNRLGKMRGSLGSINAVGAGFTAMYAGQMVANTGERAISGTIGKAMNQQFNAESVGILAGPEKGQDFYDAIVGYSNTTAWAPEDWMMSLRGAIGRSESTDDLNTYMLAMEQLALMDPAQGLEGAALAIRELNSGDSRSLVERFELPRSALDDIRKMEDPIEQVKAMMEVVGDYSGFTADAVQRMKELPLMQWEKLTNLTKTAFGYMGTTSMEKIAPYIEKMNKAFEDGKMNGIIQTVDEKFGNFTQGVIDFIAGFDMGAMAEKMRPFTELLTNMKDSVVEAWPTVVEIFDNVRSVLGQTADMVNDSWPLVNTVLQGALDVIKNISNWIQENWVGISVIILGVFTAMMTLQVANAIAGGITLLNTAIMLWRNGTMLMTAAQWLMNTALMANPIGLVIGLIVGLAAGLFLAYQKSETFREAVQKVLGWLKDVGVGAIELGKSAIEGLVSGFKSATEWIGQAWEKFKGFAKAVKDNPLVSNAINGAKAVGNFITGKGTGHHGGLERVPYNGYLARLHEGERVLTRSEAKQLDKGGMGGTGVTVTGNTFIVRQDSDIDAIAEALLQKLQEAKTAMG